MANIKNFTRALDGEAIIEEANGMMSREQIILVANNTLGYPPNSILAQYTAGGDTGKWGLWDPDGANGMATPVGYLYESRPKSAGTQRAVVLCRDCELNGKKIAWPSNADQADITAAIAALIALNTTKNYGGVRVTY